jgi:hypothetical protein
VRVVDALQDANRRVERWADAHPRAWMLFAATLSGATLTAAATASGNLPLFPDAVVAGTLFAAAYTALETLLS